MTPIEIQPQGWQDQHQTAGQSHFFIIGELKSACGGRERDINRGFTPSATGGFVCTYCYFSAQKLEEIQNEYRSDI